MANGNGHSKKENGAGEAKALGRPTSYRSEYCQAIIKFFDRPYFTKTMTSRVTKKDGSVEEFFKDIANEMPLFSAFAYSIGTHTQRLTEWTKQFPDFQEAYKKAHDLQEKFLAFHGLKGGYEQPFAIFAAKNLLNWRDRQEIIEMKFIFTLVERFNEAASKTLPDKCPHCKGLLGFREDLARELEALSQRLEVKVAS